MKRIVELACQFGRHGCRRVTVLLRREGWRVNLERVERIWRHEGLKVPHKQPKRRRLWLAHGSCVRRRPERCDPIWSYDFVLERTHDGQPFRMLTILDEYTRECLAIRVRRKLSSDDVLDCLAELFALRGTPARIRSDNGPELTAKAVRRWLEDLSVGTLSIEPENPGRAAAWRASMGGCATSS